MALRAEVEQTAEREQQEEQREQDEQHQRRVRRRRLAELAAPSLRTHAGDVVRLRVVHAVAVRVAEVAEQRSAHSARLVGTAVDVALGALAGVADRSVDAVGNTSTRPSCYLS